MGEGYIHGTCWNGLPIFVDICLCKRDAKTYMVNYMYSSTPGRHNHTTRPPDDYDCHPDFTDWTESMKNKRKLGHL